ncbi:hypothetical protein [Luteimonas sp. TWI1437]|uniref:hypothetical protein n=1 Tax=unclassified Luteimonas TaxID=2629088 RepID=UPI00320A1512
MNSEQLRIMLGALAAITFILIVACSKRAMEVELKDGVGATPTLPDKNFLSEDERSVVESSFSRGLGSERGRFYSTELLFVERFPEISGLGAPWLESFVLSGAAESVARNRSSELGLEFGASSRNHTLLLVTAWEVVSGEAVGRDEAQAVLRQLETEKERSDAQTDTIHALTAAVLLESSSRAQASQDARQELSALVREDFKSTIGVDFASLQIGRKGFSKKDG